MKKMHTDEDEKPKKKTGRKTKCEGETKVNPVPKFLTERREGLRKTKRVYEKTLEESTSSEHAIVKLKAGVKNINSTFIRREFKENLLSLQQ